MHIFYLIDFNDRNKGYVTQCAEKLLSYAFNEAHVPFVNGGCDKDNIASYKVMEKIDMIKDGYVENGDPMFYINDEMTAPSEQITPMNSRIIRSYQLQDERYAALGGNAFPCMQAIKRAKAASAFALSISWKSHAVESETPLLYAALKERNSVVKWFSLHTYLNAV